MNLVSFSQPCRRASNVAGQIVATLSTIKASISRTSCPISISTRGCLFAIFQTIDGRPGLASVSLFLCDGVQPFTILALPIGSSALQAAFGYMDTAESQAFKNTSPQDMFESLAQNHTHFTSLGLASQPTPPLSPVIASPSLSAQVRTVRSPIRTQVDPVYELSQATFSNSITPIEPTLQPRLTTPPPTEAETKLMEDIIKTPTPPPYAPLSRTTTPARMQTKRKDSGVKFAESTPAAKKRKVIPKTPYPDSEEGSDSENDAEDADDETFASPEVLGEVSDLSSSVTVEILSTQEESTKPAINHQDDSKQVIEEPGSSDEGQEEAVIQSVHNDQILIEDITTPSPVYDV